MRVFSFSLCDHQFLEAIWACPPYEGGASTPLITPQAIEAKLTKVALYYLIT